MTSLAIFSTINFDVFENQFFLEYYPQEPSHKLFKVAEHSFSALLLMQFSTCTRISKSKHVANRAIILFTQHPHYLCYFSL